MEARRRACHKPFRPSAPYIGKPHGIRPGIGRHLHTVAAFVIGAEDLDAVGAGLAHLAKVSHHDFVHRVFTDVLSSVSRQSERRLESLIFVNAERLEPSTP
jgi:hypothetical protein